MTTFQPHTDTTHIPCVSVLDFWLPGGAVELVIYAHSIDFGAKGHGSLAELASLQHHVAGELGLPVGRLLMIVKSAHVYETELAYVRGVLAENEAAVQGEATVPSRGYGRGRWREMRRKFGQDLTERVVRLSPRGTGPNQWNRRCTQPWGVMFREGPTAGESQPVTCTHAVRSAILSA